MWLVRDKSFKRIIKISKQKKSSKVVQIIEAHNKSLNMKPEMLLKVDD